MTRPTTPTTTLVLRRAARATTRAARAAADRDDAIRAAVAAGYPLRAVAQACGLSFQRVHQLARAGTGSDAAGVSDS